MRFEKAKPSLKNDENTFVSGVFDVIGDSPGIKKKNVAFVQDAASLLVQFKSGTRELHPERFRFSHALASTASTQHTKNYQETRRETQTTRACRVHWRALARRYRS
jgi:hypothetical protein